jgi:hypothetical protein
MQVDELCKESITIESTENAERMNKGKRTLIAIEREEGREE